MVKNGRQLKVASGIRAHMLIMKWFLMIWLCFICRMFLALKKCKEFADNYLCHLRHRQPLNRHHRPHHRFS